MQLKVELLTGPAAGEVRLVGGGAGRFVIGTSPGATWLLPLTADAPGDLQIDTTREGLVAVLISGTAYLDQRALTRDMPRPLLPGAVLQVAGHQLRAEAAGGTASAAAGAASHPTTISAILADVAPGGVTSDGIVAASGGTDGFSTLVAASEDRPEWASLGQYRGPETVQDDAPSLGPTADASSEASRSFLPDDWAFTAQPSDRQQRLTQSRVSTATLRIGQMLDTDPEASPEPTPDPGTRAFLKGAALQPEELMGALPPQMEGFGQMLRELLTALARLEESHDRIRAELDLSTPLPHTAARQADATLLSVGRAPDLALQSLTKRLADLEDLTHALLEGTRRFASAARDQLDPAVIEAATAAEGRMGTRLNPGGAAWATYRQRYGTEPSPLSTTALAEAIRAAGRPEAGKKTDESKRKERQR